MESFSLLISHFSHHHSRHQPVYHKTVMHQQNCQIYQILRHLYIISHNILASATPSPHMNRHQTFIKDQNHMIRVADKLSSYFKDHNLYITSFTFIQSLSRDIQFYHIVKIIKPNSTRRSLEIILLLHFYHQGSHACYKHYQQYQATIYKNQWASLLYGIRKSITSKM